MRSTQFTPHDVFHMNRSQHFSDCITGAPHHKWKECSDHSILKRQLVPLKQAAIYIIMGWGLLSQFPPFRYFPNFSASSKHTLAIEYHVYIWQVSPQLSYSDTWRIWKLIEESNMYCFHIENFADGEIYERSFSNSHPWTWHLMNSNCHRDNSQPHIYSKCSNRKSWVICEYWSWYLLKYLKTLSSNMLEVPVLWLSSV